jgi:hypothetical protein
MGFFVTTIASVAIFMVFAGGLGDALSAAEPLEEGKIAVIAPPENDFYSKSLAYAGIPIKAHWDVSDKALFEAKKRLATMLDKLPEVRQKLREAGAELHIIGRNHVTSDLPEYREMKGKPFDGKQTVDERTRGLGGLLSSCGEENLLQLPEDRYRGRDICVHEFAHDIFDNGIEEPVREQFYKQHEKSLEKGLWVGSYAGGDKNEYFSELSMWYFGTHGDLNMKGEKPKNGREGLKQYDPDGFSLIERFYEGKLQSAKASPPEKAEVNAVPSGIK